MIDTYYKYCDLDSEDLTLSLTLVPTPCEAATIFDLQLSSPHMYASLVLDSTLQTTNTSHLTPKCCVRGALTSIPTDKIYNAIKRTAPHHPIRGAPPHPNLSLSLPLRFSPIMDASDDPFLSVQSDVLSTLTSTRHLFSSYLRIRTLSPSPTSPELIQSRQDLQANLETLTADLADLLDSVAAVESDPYAFGLDVAEVQRRRGFVRDVGDEVEGMRRELEGVTESTHVAGPATITSSNTANNRGGAGGAKAAGKLPNPASFEDEQQNNDDDDDPYGEFAAQQQEMMMREQDEQLDGVFQSVGVLRGQAVDMGRELEEQGVLLDEVDTLADRVGGKLSVGVKKVGEVIRKNEDSVSSCCIGVLIVVLIILLILLIAL